MENAIQIIIVFINLSFLFSFPIIVARCAARKGRKRLGYVLISIALWILPEIIIAAITIPRTHGDYTLSNAFVQLIGCLIVGYAFFGFVSMLSDKNLKSFVSTQEVIDSFPDININKFNYIIAFLYLREEDAQDDFKKIIEKDIEAIVPFHMQIRKVKESREYPIQLLFYFENALQYDDFIKTLGNGDFKEGREHISSNMQEDYFGANEYKTILDSSTMLKTVHF